MIHSSRPGGRRLVDTAALALVTATYWWAWMAWDRVPYAAWQVAGCALCLVATVAVAARRLPAWIVVLVVPVVFTAAWSATASAYDPSGLWAVGAVLVLVGTLLSTVVVVVIARAVRVPR